MTNTTLLDLLAEIADLQRPEPVMVPFEEAYSRYQQLSRSVYRMVRDAHRHDEMHLLLPAAADQLRLDGPRGAASAMILEGFRLLVMKKIQENPDQFKDDFIAALDIAVQEIGHGLKETHDSCTKQSTSLGPD